MRTTRTEGGHHRVADTEIERLLAKQQPEAPGGRRPPADDEALGGLSARNRLHGYVEEVRVDGLLAQVRLRVGTQSLTAVITADAVRSLRLKRGDDAIAIVKSTEVMIAKAPADATRGHAERHGPASKREAAPQREPARLAPGADVTWRRKCARKRAMRSRPGVEITSSTSPVVWYSGGACMSVTRGDLQRREAAGLAALHRRLGPRRSSCRRPSRPAGTAR